MKDKKLYVYIGCGFLVLLFILLLVFVLAPKKEEEVPQEPEISDQAKIPEVEPEQAVDIYNDTARYCEGTFVWDLQGDETIEIDNVQDLQNMNTCHKDQYHSKMIGYTYDLEGNLVVHVNVLKVNEGKLYKLDDTFVADYSEETLDASLNYGTTYEYIYQPDQGNYRLIEVKLMDLPNLE